jgi:dienelactone hydrolase
MNLLTCAAVAALLGGADVGRPVKAKAMLDAMNKGDFATASKDFDKTMKEKMPPDKFAELWKAVNKQLGGFKKLQGTKSVKAGTSEAIDLRCEFAKMTVIVRISFNKDDQVQGFFIRPAPAEKFDPPPYAKAGSYREEAVTVGAGGDWPLPGTLTLPVGKPPFPAVVLVQGSGPHDRDETILANKPFRDLAWGLAGRGVAVLRYEKRTQEHALKMVNSKAPVTLQTEVIDDALAAAKLLRERKEIDPARVFVLGHSLGAVCAPRVGQLDGKLAGLVLLAGNSRPLEDLVLEQFTYLYSLEGGPSDEQKKELEELKKKLARVKDPKLADDTPGKELPLGAPASYWKSLKALDQTGVAARITTPLLVLQGERDYQVTMADFAGWKKALAGRKGVTLKSYPALNHLFMEGKGKSRPEEYAQPGHVALEVVEDVARWVKGR